LRPELCAVHFLEPFDRFDFHDDAFFDEQVDSMLALIVFGHASTLCKKSPVRWKAFRVTASQVR
jgi:hypothetical protein